MKVSKYAMFMGLVDCLHSECNDYGASRQVNHDGKLLFDLPSVKVPMLPKWVLSFVNDCSVGAVVEECA